jgi:hypothetical protein
MILKKNVGYMDSLLRAIIGTLIVALGIYFNSYWGFIGLIPVISGAVSFCPVYRFMRISTLNPNVEREN